MLSSALKSFSSNISSNYNVSAAPVSASGIWKIHNGKNKKTGKAISVFIFERKSLDSKTGGLGARSGGASLRQLQDEVIARIKKEPNMLAKLRHPSILELAEPIEDTRSGGLMFATEPVTASLADLLRDKDNQEERDGNTGRSSKYVVEEADGSKRRRELELDELEIQKGLLQIAQGLEFLHESAMLVHGNLTPDAIYVNSKSDWKIAGFGFAGPPDDSDAKSSLVPLSLSEALYHDPRLPRSVQLDLDYTSPDFVMDSTVSTATDMFTLGLLLLALYNSPHTSPVQSNKNLSAYKKLFNSSSTMPSLRNNFLCSRPLPNDLKSDVLPRLITRRPGQRMNAREFQQSAFFDNILVSSIRFLDALPAKTPNEKSQYLRGLPKILDQLPKSVLDRKFLPALLEETKDQALLYLILSNVFHIIHILPSDGQAMTEKVLPCVQEIFASDQKYGGQERDTSREAGLAVILNNMSLIGKNCNGKDFKYYILPILRSALESSTHAIVDKALGCLQTLLSILDFSTIKNELFPTVASVFSKTSSLGIKVRGLEAFAILCGGSVDSQNDESDEFSGIAARPKTNNNTVLDKYTVQEKVVPLLKAIKTKEPSVMMAALAVFKQVGHIADAEFLASETLPILWSLSLGPLLNLQQFRHFMDLIKEISSRIELEQTKKLRDLASSNSNVDTIRPNDLMSVEPGGKSSSGVADNEDVDFERLVLGSKATRNVDMFVDMTSSNTSFKHTMSLGAPEGSVLSWPTQEPTQSSRPLSSAQGLGAISPLSPISVMGAQSNVRRTVANGLNSFAAMQPTKPRAPALLAGQQLGTSTPSALSVHTTSQRGATDYISQFSIAPPSAGKFQAPAKGDQSRGIPGQQTSDPEQFHLKKNGLDAYESLL